MEFHDVLILPLRSAMARDGVYSLQVVRYARPPLDPYWMLGPIRKKKKTIQLKKLDGRRFPVERLYIWLMR